MFIGITGSIGSGKTTVSRMLGDNFDYFEVINADNVVGDLFMNEKIFSLVKKRFFNYNWDKYTRKDFADYIFKQPDRVELLQKTLFPFVFYEIGSIATESIINAYLPVFDMPLLFETNFNIMMDLNVVVAVDENTRFERLEKRGFGREESENRLKYQIQQEKKIEQADFVIWNNGDWDETEKQVSFFVQTLKNYEFDLNLLDEIKRDLKNRLFLD